MGIQLRENEIYFHAKICTQIYIAALLKINANYKQLQCPVIGEWINKLDTSMQGNTTKQ